MNNLALEYERDIHAWTLHQMELLRRRQFAEMDVEHLIEELETMANRDKHELESRLAILIAHLLKWQYQSDKRSGSWEGSIIEQRYRIDRQLAGSPSLNPHLLVTMLKAYPAALKLAIKETRLAPSIFPESCPYSMEQLLDEDFFPESQ